MCAGAGNINAIKAMQTAYVFGPPTGSALWKHESKFVHSCAIVDSLRSVSSHYSQNARRRCTWKTCSTDVSRSKVTNLQAQIVVEWSSVHVKLVKKESVKSN